MGRDSLAKNPVSFLVLAFLAGMLGGVLVPYHRAAPQTTGGSAVIYGVEEAMISSARQVAPSVVSVVPTRDLPIYQNDPLDFDNSYYESLIFGELTEPHIMTLGSGIIVQEDGWVLTSAHVVDDKNLLYSVVLEDGRFFQVSDTVFSEQGDMALLHLQNKNGEAPSGLPTAQLSKSDRLQVGQYALSIGSTPGSVRHSVSSGIISALDRSITASGYEAQENLSHLIQTDTGIQPGFSGGPLINLQGEVIGMNTAVTTDGAQMGFAIPSELLRDFISKELAL